MTRKFSFQITPLKVTTSTSSPVIDIAPVIEFMESSSPPFVPDSPLFEPREPLSPEIELELRVACGIILRNLKPSGQIYEDIAKSEYNEALARRRLQQPRLEQRAPRSAASKPPESLPESYRPQPPLNRTVTSASSKSYRHVPTNAGNGFAHTAGSRHTSLHHRRDSLETARIPNFSQQLESRVQRAMNQEPQRPQTAGSDTTSFTNSANEAHISDIHPAFRSTTSTELTRPSTSTTATRPPSRRSRIAEYIRPSSSQSHRPSSSHSNMSSSSSIQNVAPSTFSSGWWRPLLSARRSTSSLRTSLRPSSSSAEEYRRRLEAEHQARVDLNRALPPLPSLSTWMPSSAAHIEHADDIPPPTRPPPTHISQLLRMKTNGSNTTSTTNTNGAFANSLGTGMDGEPLRAMPTRVEDDVLTFRSTRYDDIPPVPLGTLDPNSTLTSRVQTRIGQEINEPTDLKVTNGHINGNGVANGTNSASGTGGKFGRLRKQLSRFTLGSGGIGESGRVAF